MVDGKVWVAVQDLTVIFLTANRVPKTWAEYQKRVLLEAVGDKPIVTISYVPLDWGINLIQTDYGLRNLFEQMLRGAKLATTPYVAVAEDDILYPKEHFEFRPPLDCVSYDMNRWVIFTWGKPFYFKKPSQANAGMIAPRELLIKAIEEKITKYPTGLPRGLFKEVGRENYEKMNGITPVPRVDFEASQPFLCFNHDFSVETAQRQHKKKAWPIRCDELPVWGRAEDVVKEFR